MLSFEMELRLGIYRQVNVQKNDSETGTDSRRIAKEEMEGERESREEKDSGLLAQWGKAAR